MLAQGRDGPGNTAYERHHPEQTLLYQLVEAHFPALVEQLAQQGKSLLPRGRPQDGKRRRNCQRSQPGDYKPRQLTQPGVYDER